MKNVYLSIFICAVFAVSAFGCRGVELNSDPGSRAAPAAPPAPAPAPPSSTPPVSGAQGIDLRGVGVLGGTGQVQGGGMKMKASVGVTVVNTASQTTQSSNMRLNFGSRAVSQ